MLTRLRARRILRIRVPGFGEFHIPVRGQKAALEFLADQDLQDRVQAIHGGGSCAEPTIYCAEAERLTTPVFGFTATISLKENETK